MSADVAVTGRSAWRVRWMASARWRACTGTMIAMARLAKLQQGGLP